MGNPGGVETFAICDDQIRSFREYSRDVSIAELGEGTGLEANQVSARSLEVVKERFAESPRRGVFRAFPAKIEAFLKSLPKMRSDSVDK